MTLNDYIKIHSDDSPEKMVEQLVTESDLIATSLVNKFKSNDSHIFNYWNREYQTHIECQKWLAGQLINKVKPHVLPIEDALKAPFVWLESKDGTLHDMYRIRQVPIDSTAIMIYKTLVATAFLLPWIILTSVFAAGQTSPRKNNKGR